MTEITYTTTHLNEEEKAEVRKKFQEEKKDEALDALLDKDDIGNDALLDEVRAETAIEGDLDDEGYESDEERAKASAEVVTPVPSSLDSFNDVPVSSDLSLTRSTRHLSILLMKYPKMRVSISRNFPQKGPWRKSISQKSSRQTRIPKVRSSMISCLERQGFRGNNLQIPRKRRKSDRNGRQKERG
jgi:hypothetical protein